MKLYNTYTRKKEEFHPMQDEVKFYSCGPTVYNYFHIGNARAFIIFDALRNYLEYRGYKVKFVQNFTDVDDKIINKANEEGVDALEISNRYIKEYFKDADALGIRRADIYPRVSEHIDDIIQFISELIEKGYAYESDGDVYFRVLKFEKYGKLSGQSADELRTAVRIDENNLKENSLDFTLWKSQKPGEIRFESPWGMGRPGWHIECSVMSKKHLGKNIDIHSGGIDLIFPHHENEIAQSESLNDMKYVNFWLHNGLITTNKEKMSKSTGNFFNVRDVLKKYDKDVIRWFMFSSHYRSPLEFSEEVLNSIKTSLERLKNFNSNINYLLNNTSDELSLDIDLSKYKEQVISSLDDDFNTAEAIGYIYEFIRDINKLANEKTKKQDLANILADFNQFMSLFNVLSDEPVDMIDEEIENLIAERQHARANKDYKKSDEIRDMLLSMNIVLEDTKAGVKWKRI